jgi:hypothetical protein
MCRNAVSTSFSEKLALRAMQSRHIGRSMMSAVTIAAVSGMIHDSTLSFLSEGFLQTARALTAGGIDGNGRSVRVLLVEIRACPTASTLYDVADTPCVGVLAQRQRRSDSGPWS